MYFNPETFKNSSRTGKLSVYIDATSLKSLKTTSGTNEKFTAVPSKMTQEVVLQHSLVFPNQKSVPYR